MALWTNVGIGVFTVHGVVYQISADTLIYAQRDIKVSYY